MKKPFITDILLLASLIMLVLSFLKISSLENKQSVMEKEITHKDSLIQSLNNEIDFILKSFPQFNWAHDETLEFNDKTSTRRPDLILQLSNKCIIIEIDENQHKNKEYNILSDWLTERMKEEKAKFSK